MSLLRPQLANRLILSSNVLPRHVAMRQVRYAGGIQASSGEVPKHPPATISPATQTADPSQPPGPLKGDSEMIKQESPGEGLVDHQPDYHAPIDHGTSQFSPVPHRILDGSEPGDMLPAAVLSGAPVDLQARTVRIFRPAKTATQSGDWHGHYWRMDWDVLQKGHRWENPLMGWQSSADYLQGTHLNFKSKEDAIRFAQKQGYEYFVQEHNERKFTPKAYANNFMHSPKKLKKIPTK